MMSAPVARLSWSDRIAGVRSTWPAIRAAAASISRMVTVMDEIETSCWKIQRQETHPPSPSPPREGEQRHLHPSLQGRGRGWGAPSQAQRDPPAGANAQNLIGSIARRRRHRHRVALLLPDQRLGQRRLDRQQTLLDVGLIDADDLIREFLLRLLVHQLDMGAELHMVAGQKCRVNYLSGRGDLLELLDAALDE